jgi:putative FmdB family regulatory protein
MPTYEYSCKQCGHDLEVFQRMSDDPLEMCPECSTPALKRKIGRGAGIIFKGGGFYETDFKERKGKPSGAEAPADKPAASESKAGAAEPKPAPKAGTKAAPAKADG